MRFDIDVADVLRRADVLANASAEVLDGIERAAFGRGQDAVRFIQRRFREGAPYTTPSRTARRTGGLYDAYDSAVEAFTEGSERGVDLRVGLIKPGLDDEVMLRGRVHEGLDAAGNPVSSFTILPRAGEFLKFRLPPEKGGRWVTTKGPITLTPRPSLPEVERRLPPYLNEDVQKAFREAVLQ